MMTVRGIEPGEITESLLSFSENHHTLSLLAAAAPEIVSHSVSVPTPTGNAIGKYEEEQEGTHMQEEAAHSLSSRSIRHWWPMFFFFFVPFALPGQGLWKYFCGMGTNAFDTYRQWP